MSSQHTAKSFLIYGSQILSLGMRFLSNIILAWLLVPADFGTAAVVFTIITGVALFADVGIADSLIRHEDGEKGDFIQTAQALMLIRGIVIYGVVFLIAPLTEDYFSIPGLTTYLRIAAISLIFLGCCSVRIIILERNMQVIPGVVIQFISQLITVVVVIVLAIVYRNVWPLVLSSLISSIVVMILGQSYKPSFINIKKINTDYVSDIFSFRKWILLSTLFTFLIINSDRLVLAKMSDTTITGIYNLGLMLGSIIFGVVIVLVQKLLYPVVSDLSRSDMVGQKLDQEIDKTLRGFMPIALSGTLIIFVIAPLFFNSLYSEAYFDAGFVAQVMSIVCWFMLLYTILNKTYIALNLSLIHI